VRAAAKPAILYETIRDIPLAVLDPSAMGGLRTAVGRFRLLRYRVGTKGRWLMLCLRRV
jgi:hypothetical protein